MINKRCLASVNRFNCRYFCGKVQGIPDVVVAKPEDFFKKRDDKSKAFGSYYRLGEVIYLQDNVLETQRYFFYISIPECFYAYILQIYTSFFRVAKKTFFFQQNFSTKSNFFSNLFSPFFFHPVSKICYCFPL